MHQSLCCYRAMPHGTTKLAPAELMFPGCKFHTRLPVRVIAQQLDFEELSQRDLEKKMQMKAHVDKKKKLKTSDIQVGDAVLVKQEPSSKTSPPYEGVSHERCSREREHKLWPKGEMAAPLQGRRHFSRRYPTTLQRRQADGS